MHKESYIDQLRCVLQSRSDIYNIPDILQDIFTGRISVKNIVICIIYLLLQYQAKIGVSYNGSKIGAFQSTLKVRRLVGGTAGGEIS